MEKHQKLFKKWGRQVDLKTKQVLNIFIDKKNKNLVEYQIASGGKRLRPALAIASCLACGGKAKDALYPAAGLEILHNCTLIYDDIIDNSKLRRGIPTVWFEFGKSIAECIGINYAVAVFQAADKSKNPLKISEIFAKAMKKVVQGQILDILFEQSGRRGEKYIIANRYRQISEKDYLEMVSKKTSSLIKACCQAGAVSAAAEKSQVKALSDYGLNLGIAFQIQDDILDIFGQGKKFGKKIGKDIEERKLGNIVVFYALKEFSSKQRKKFLSILRKEKLGNKEIKEALGLIKKTKAKQKSASLGEKYARRAKKSLSKLPQNKWNRLLHDIADFVIKREK